jgi:acyl carrier protein
MQVEPTELRAVIVRAIADAAEIDPDVIRDDLNLFDLGLDSLNFAGILIDVEDAVGEEVPAEVLDRFLDVGDVVTIGGVVSLLAAGLPTDAGILRPQDDVVVVQQP